MRQWWDEVPYSGDEQPPFQMQIEAPEVFDHPCGFIRLKERHRVKAPSRKISSTSPKGSAP
jgi:hypothetical protein